MKSELSRLHGFLRDARRALTNHLDTRPATKTEALEIKKGHEKAAESYRAKAEILVRETGADSHRRYHDALRASRLEEMRAASWECPGEDMKEAWDKTKAILEARVVRSEAEVIKYFVSAHKCNGQMYKVLAFRPVAGSDWGVFEVVASSWDKSEAMEMFLENKRRGVWGKSLRLEQGDTRIYGF